MELSRSDTKNIKGIAILMMVMLHLFCRKDVNGLYETYLTVGSVPLVYYISLFGDACRPIYLFVSGYAFFIMITKEPVLSKSKNLKRLIKLMVNFWIVLLIFIPIGYLSGKSDLYPGSINEFLLNFFALSNSYNGAWWFLQIYIIFVLLAPIIVKITRKNSSLILLSISILIYLLSYIQRFKHILDFGDNSIILMFIKVIVLLGTSQLSFIVGAIFAKEKIISKLHNKIHNKRIKNLLCITGISILILIHALYESAIIAPFNAISFICFFVLMDKSHIIKNTLSFFANHSTNIWLTHMFFYMTIFPEFTFSPRFPLLIFVWLITLCIVSSYIINLIYNPIVRRIDSKEFIFFKVNRKNEEKASLI